MTAAPVRNATSGKGNTKAAEDGGFAALIGALLARAQGQPQVPVAAVPQGTGNLPTEAAPKQGATQPMQTGSPMPAGAASLIAQGPSSVPLAAPAIPQPLAEPLATGTPPVPTETILPPANPTAAATPQATTANAPAQAMATPTAAATPAPAKDAAAALKPNLAALTTPAGPTSAPAPQTAPLSAPPPALQVAREVASLHRQGMDQVRFTLEPADLGRVSITLRRSEVRTEIRIAVERPAALEALRPHLHALAAASADQTGAQVQPDRDVRLSLMADDGRGGEHQRGESDPRREERSARQDTYSRRDEPPRPISPADDDLIL